MSDDSEFDGFALTAWPRLLWAAYLLTGDHGTAEDLAQTALIRTYAAWSRVRRDDALAYSRKVLINLNIDRLRRRHPLEVGVDQLVAEPTTPDAAASADERDELFRLLAGLTEREREVVVLRHYFDMPEVAVARQLRIAEGTVKSTLARALGKLRVYAEAADHLDSTRGQS